MVAHAHPQGCQMQHAHFSSHLDCIMPKGGTFRFVDGVSIFNRFGEQNPKLMCMLMV
jgi:hypothetical protein